mgnify:FL=1
MSHPEATPGRIDCYEIMAVVGGGALSIVYRAVDTRSKTAVALKLPRPSAIAEGPREDIFRRFAREAAIGRRITHPGVVPVLDSSTHRGQPYLAMAWIDGPPLTATLEHSPVTPAYAAAIVARLAETLAPLHQAGIVHRDVKPQNVLLRQPSEPMLTDFGVAQCPGVERELAAEFSGTPASMAPEQIRGDRLDGRADVFALGILLYRLLTGRRPFDGSFSQVVNQILSVEPTPPSRVDPSLPSEFDGILRDAMAKHRDRRCSAAALAGRLRTFLEPLDERHANRTYARGVEYHRKFGF